MRINEIKTSSSKISELKQFISWACDQLDIDTMPTVKFGTDLADVKQKRTFGSTNDGGNIWVHIANRNTADTMRTLCHELVHHKQFEIGTAHADMTKEQTQSIEDEANAIAGRMMRDYGAQHEEIYESVAISNVINQALKQIK